MPKGYYENLRDQMSPEEWKRLHQGSFEAVDETKHVFEVVIVVPTGDVESARVFPVHHTADDVGFWDGSLCCDVGVMNWPKEPGVWRCRLEMHQSIFFAEDLEYRIVPNTLTHLWAFVKEPRPTGWFDQNEGANGIRQDS